MVRYPPWYLVLHRHICAIPHFATYCAIIVRCPTKTSTKTVCDTIATSIARYEKYRCWASKTCESGNAEGSRNPWVIRMARKVLWKIGTLICQPVTLRPRIFLQNEAVLINYLPVTSLRNARLFGILFVRNFWAICSQFWLSVRNSVWGPFDRNSRENPSLCWLGGGGFRGTKIVNKHFVNKRAFPIRDLPCDSLRSEVWSPLNFATHEMEDPNAPVGEKLKYHPFWGSPLFYKAPPRQFQPPKCKLTPSKIQTVEGRFLCISIQKLQIGGRQSLFGGCQFTFWRVPIYILEAEIVLGVLYRKGVIPKKGGTLDPNAPGNLAKHCLLNHEGFEAP